MILDTPWKLKNHLRRVIAIPRYRLHFALHGVEWGLRWRVFGKPILQRHRHSRILLGDGLSLRSTPESNPLSPRSPIVLSTRKPGAVIEIGNDCGLTGVVIVAAERVSIGKRVIVGANAVVTDTNFHPLSPEGRLKDMAAGEHRPVTICDDVFVGMQAIILKGVTLGEGCVVGAGSVVTKDVPARAIVAGNPARVVGTV